MIATARATGRVLTGAGLDFHDLAGAVEEPPKVQYRERPQPPPPAGPPQWGSLEPAERLAWLNLARTAAWASEWERSFAADMWAKVHSAPHTTLSTNQKASLARLLARAFAHGVLP